MKVLHELKKRGSWDEKAPGMLHTVKWEMTSAICTPRTFAVVNRTLVPHYSISMTTGGNGRRSRCVEHYRQDVVPRLDVSV